MIEMLDRKRKLLYILIASVSFLISTFIIYTKFYYGELNSNSIQTNFIICFNIILRISYKIIDKLTTSLLTESNIKVIIISVAIIFTIHKLELKEILFGITNLEVGAFKLQRAAEVLNNLNVKEIEKIERLEDEKCTDENEQKFQISKQKIKLLQTMIDDPYVLVILEKLLNKKKGILIIPMNVFKQNTSVEAIREIFDYEVKVNSVIISGIKEPVKDLVYEIYVNLKDK